MALFSRAADPRHVAHCIDFGQILKNDVACPTLCSSAAGYKAELELAGFRVRHLHCAWMPAVHFVQTDGGLHGSGIWLLLGPLPQVSEVDDCTADWKVFTDERVKAFEKDKATLSQVLGQCATGDSHVTQPSCFGLPAIVCLPLKMNSFPKTHPNFLGHSLELFRRRRYLRFVAAFLYCCP